MKLVLCLLFSVNCFGYVISRTGAGAEIKWTQGNSNLNLFVNPNPVSTDIDLDVSNTEINLLGLTEEEYVALRFQEIVDEAITEWNTVSPYQLNAFYEDFNGVSFTDSDNSVAFSDNFSFFSNGVLAITSLSFQGNTGEINSADILINQSFSSFIDFTLDETSSSNDKAYLGDILTHELGHMLGLAHSETIGSTMGFSVFKNQHTISDDDKHGVLTNYNIELTKGSLTGTVISNTGSPIFGAYVKLLSVIDNTVVQGQFTNEDGQFLFDNIDVDGSYSLLVLPAKKLESLPQYYRNVKTDYCAGKDFVPSFFYSCGARGKSRPQVITMETDLVELGDFTIRCDENLDPLYLASKINNEIFEVNNNSRASNFSFVGMFFEDEVSENASDSFSIDFTNQLIDIDSNQVKFNFMSTGLGSLMKLDVTIVRGDGASRNLVIQTDETGKVLTDFSTTFDLSSTMSDNIFQVTVTPFELSDDESFEIFSGPSELKNSNHLYHMIAMVGVTLAGEFTPLMAPDTYPYEENRSCAEGTLSYSADAYTPLSLVRGNGAQSNDDSNIFSCATIDLGGGGSNSGPLSFVLGFIMLVFVRHFRQLFLS